jgi:hypothetical protein
MSGIITHAVRSLAGPPMKRSFIAAYGGGGSSPCRWRRPSPISSSRSTAAFSSTPPSNNDDPPPSTAASQSSGETKNNRLRALSLYRQLLRGAERMPTPNRQNYVKRKTRSEFRRHMTLTDQEEIDFQLRLADTNLDTVLVQAEHLSRLFNDPEYQNYN